MPKQTTFTQRQIAAAIRAGLREGRQSVDLSPSEAEVKAATYRGNLAHYREHVHVSLDAGDYLQAAEKSWGSYAQTVKAIGADHRLSITHHASIIGVASRLVTLARRSDATSGGVLRLGLSGARSLHQHFYENDLSDDMVIETVDDVSATIDLMHELFAPEGAA